jgi:hypothetical protein
MAEVPDKRLLALPGVGPGILARIRRITHGQQWQRDLASPRLTDAELLNRLDYLQNELQRVRYTLEASIAGASRSQTLISQASSDGCSTSDCRTLNTAV